MIRLENLTKHFGEGANPVVAVNDVTLEVPSGEICVLLGPSGCGKTTTMRMINRLIEPTSGRIFIDGKDVTRVDPIALRRTVGYVIQQIGLFPHKTVEDNICVVPDLLGWERGRSRARARELLELVGLQPDLFLRRYPKELSGGQQQRVGVLRALAADPPLMLMDEPFGAIDPINREVIQDEFLKMQRELRKTIIFVSHDLDEAVKMADKIAIFRGGRLEQFATPNDLLANPCNTFVESFLGGDRALKRLRLIRSDAAMVGDFARVAPETPLGEARARMAAQDDPAAIVVDRDGKPLGVLRRDEAGTGDGTVAMAFRADPVAVPAATDLRIAVSLMLTHDLPALACVDGEGKAVGMLTYRSIVATLRARGPEAGR
ncbi:MAG: ABC transporter ATP-binding protein [Paracoccaceae bacterium]